MIKLFIFFSILSISISVIISILFIKIIELGKYIKITDNEILTNILDNRYIKKDKDPFFDEFKKSLDNRYIIKNKDSFFEEYIKLLDNRYIIK